MTNRRESLYVSLRCTELVNNGAYFCFRRKVSNPHLYRTRLLSLSSGLRGTVNTESTHAHSQRGSKYEIDWVVITMSGHVMLSLFHGGLEGAARRRRKPLRTSRLDEGAGVRCGAVPLVRIHVCLYRVCIKK